MKYLLLAITLFFFCSNSYSQKVVIDTFEDLNTNKFSDNQQEITTEAVNAGFKIEVKDTSKIETVQQKNAAGIFIEVSVSDDVIVDGKVYDIKNALIENDKLVIILIKGGNKKTVTLSVNPSASSTRGISTSCVPTQPTDSCREVKSYDNFFGENVKYYDKRKIVYVYDFNKDPSKREFYKITKKNGALKIEVVNFNKETLTSGKNVKFKIYNINKFMYDVSIADSVIHFDSEPSALFTRLFLGDSTLLGSLIGTFSDNIKLQANQDDAKSLMEKISCFVDKYNWLRKTALDALNPCYTFPYCYSIDYAEFLNSLSEIKAQEDNVKRKLNKAKNDVQACNNQIKLKVKVENDIKNLNFAISKLNIRFEELNSKNASLSNNINKIKDEVKLIESQIFFSKGADSLTKKAQLARLGTELTSKSIELATNRIDIAKVRKNKDSLEIVKETFVNSIDTIEFDISGACNSDIQDMIDALEISDYLIKNLPSDSSIKKLIVFINNMVEANNSHTSDYISLNGNMLDLTISIASKDSIFKYFSIPEYKNDPLQIQIPILGKPFASFSSGSFIALGKHLQNKTYAWQETVGINNTATDSSYTLVESGYTLPPMGFCALGNFEWKLTRSFGLGGSAGVGLSIEKSPRLAYLGGVSLFFGNLRQFAITGGFVGMQVNKLTNNFQTIADNQVIYSSRPDIQYYKEFKVGHFISLTYTPFNTVYRKNKKTK